MLNQIAIIGRLVREPELKQVGAENTAVVNITLAVERPRRKDADSQADFIPVVAWRKTAEFINTYFRKGQQVYVAGRLETRTYEKDGVKRTAFEVLASEVGFADAKKPESNGAGQNTGAATNFAQGTGFPQDTGLDDFGSMDGFEDIPAASDPFGGFNADPFAGTPSPSDNLPN